MLNVNMENAERIETVPSQLEIDSRTSQKNGTKKSGSPFSCFRGDGCSSASGEKKRKKVFQILLLGQILRWVVITELEPAFFSFADSNIKIMWYSVVLLLVLRFALQPWPIGMS